MYSNVDLFLVHITAVKRVIRVRFLCQNKMRPSVRAKSSGNFSKLVLNNDRLKLIILIGFVLFVFWGGVAVGIGFSHGHEPNPLPPSLVLRHPTKPIQNKFPPSTVYQDDASLIHQDSASCCNDNIPKCNACKQGISVQEYCFQHTSDSSCSSYLPSKPGIFLGDSSFFYSVPSFDFKEITISAWIYLAKGRDVQMKTILANRYSGCTLNDDHHGFALYVNEWNTEDLSLNLMWSDSFDACKKLSTQKNVISYETWHQVSMIFDSQGESNRARIFVDGKLKASSNFQEPRLLSGSKNFLVIGAHSGNERHPFDGKIAEVVVVNGVSEKIATSFPSFFAPDPDASIKAYWKEFEEKSSKDLTSNHFDLKAEKLGWQRPNNVPQPNIPFLVPVDSESDLAAGYFPRESFFLTPEMKKKSDDLARERRELVKSAMKHAWTGYEARAFGADEVTPKTGQAKNNWGGMAVTLVDALDTLWIMGLKDEFWRARDYVRDKLNFNRVGSISVFETTIRVLGGLMSAYDLSHDSAFLEKAVDLGEKLTVAFETNSGLPVNTINLAARTRSRGATAVIAEVGTLQLEFRSLAYHSKRKKFAELVEHVHDKMREYPPQTGLWPIHVNIESGHTTGGVVTFGALGDSFFEYLLKIWVQGGKIEDKYLEDYERAVDGIHRLLVQKSSPSGLYYLGDMNPGGSINHKMDHLACFVPGMLALGIKKRGESAENEQKNKRDLRLAKSLVYTCVQMYERQPTGISPEYVNWVSGNDFVVPPNAPFYILRPETVESLYILHTITGHPIYRDWGHRIMVKIEQYCKLEFGYGSLPDVRSVTRQPDDRMESFFFAETLKYLYLLQDPDSEINLDDWVFNTEAHPLKIFPKDWREKLGLN